MDTKWHNEDLIVFSLVHRLVSGWKTCRKPFFRMVRGQPHSPKCLPPFCFHCGGLEFPSRTCGWRLRKRLVKRALLQGTGCWCYTPKRAISIVTALRIDRRIWGSSDPRCCLWAFFSSQTTSHRTIGGERVWFETFGIHTGLLRCLLSENGRNLRTSQYWVNIMLNQA